MRIRRSALLVVVLTAAVAAAVSSQEISRKKEIAVFNLSYYRWSIPVSALAGIDDQIQNVFVTLGRFSVIGMTYRLGEDDIAGFIENIKRFKSENVEIPETVQMGQEFFTQADLNRLVASFIVVVPSVVDFRLQRDQEGTFTCSIRTSFSFINVEEIQTFARFSLDTSGTDKNPGNAVRHAVDAIAMTLTFKIRSIPEFQLKSGILEVRGSEVVLELGRDMGVKPGDEYLILAPRVLQSGRQIVDEKGLLEVREVRDDISIARVIYSDGPPQPGEQLQELPRLGTDTTPYLHAVVWPLGTSPFPVPTLLGFRQTVSRGFSAFRPHFGVELPLHLMIEGLPGVPVNFYVGGEYDVSFGRLQLAPMVSGGVGAFIVLREGEPPVFSHVGGSLGLEVSYLFNRDMKIELEGGWLSWVGFYGLSYGGLYAGGGLTIKF